MELKLEKVDSEWKPPEAVQEELEDSVRHSATCYRTLLHKLRTQRKIEEAAVLRHKHLTLRNIELARILRDWKNGNLLPTGTLGTEKSYPSSFISDLHKSHCIGHTTSALAQPESIVPQTYHAHFSDCSLKFMEVQELSNIIENDTKSIDKVQKETLAQTAGSSSVHGRSPASPLSAASARSIDLQDVDKKDVEDTNPIHDSENCSCEDAVSKPIIFGPEQVREMSNVEPELDEIQKEIISLKLSYQQKSAALEIKNDEISAIKLRIENIAKRSIILAEQNRQLNSFLNSESEAVSLEIAKATATEKEISLLRIKAKSIASICTGLREEIAQLEDEKESTQNDLRLTFNNELENVNVWLRKKREELIEDFHIAIGRLLQYREPDSKQPPRENQQKYDNLHSYLTTSRCQRISTISKAENLKYGFKESSVGQKLSIDHSSTQNVDMETHPSRDGPFLHQDRFMYHPFLEKSQNCKLGLGISKPEELRHSFGNQEHSLASPTLCNVHMKETNLQLSQDALSRIHDIHEFLSGTAISPVTPIDAKACENSMAESPIIDSSAYVAPIILKREPSEKTSHESEKRDFLKVASPEPSNTPNPSLAPPVGNQNQNHHIEFEKSTATCQNEFTNELESNMLQYSKQSQGQLGSKENVHSESVSKNFLSWEDRIKGKADDTGALERYSYNLLPKPYNPSSNTDNDTREESNGSFQGDADCCIYAEPIDVSSSEVGSDFQQEAIDLVSEDEFCEYTQVSDSVKSSENLSTDNIVGQMEMVLTFDSCPEISEKNPPQQNKEITNAIPSETTCRARSLTCDIYPMSVNATSMRRSSGNDIDKNGNVFSTEALKSELLKLQSESEFEDEEAVSLEDQTRNAQSVNTTSDCVKECNSRPIEASEEYKKPRRDVIKSSHEAHQKDLSLSARNEKCGSISDATLGIESEVSNPYCPKKSQSQLEERVIEDLVEYAATKRECAKKDMSNEKISSLIDNFEPEFTRESIGPLFNIQTSKVDEKKLSANNNTGTEQQSKKERSHSDESLPGHASNVHDELICNNNIRSSNSGLLPNEIYLCPEDDASQIGQRELSQFDETKKSDKRLKIENIHTVSSTCQSLFSNEQKINSQTKKSKREKNTKELQSSTFGAASSSCLTPVLGKEIASLDQTSVVNAQNDHMDSSGSIKLDHSGSMTRAKSPTEKQGWSSWFRW